MSEGSKAQGNPGVVGLAGFGITTLLLQFHNVGWCGMGPVLAVAIIFGGLAQLIAGFQEFKCGNNFGYSAFVAYGSFWIAFAILMLCNHFDIYKSTGNDIGWFLVGFTVYTSIMWIPAMRLHGAMAVTFTLLLVGFILLDFAHFGYPALTRIAGFELMACALSALYMMAAAIYAQVFGRQVLPLGRPWLSDRTDRSRSVANPRPAVSVSAP